MAEDSSGPETFGPPGFYDFIGKVKPQQGFKGTFSATEWVSDRGIVRVYKDNNFCQIIVEKVDETTKYQWYFPFDGVVQVFEITDSGVSSRDDSGADLEEIGQLLLTAPDDYGEQP